jgi:hypothetical protein
LKGRGYKEERGLCPLSKMSLPLLFESRVRFFIIYFYLTPLIPLFLRAKALKDKAYQGEGELGF